MDTKHPLHPQYLQQQILQPFQRTTLKSAIVFVVVVVPHPLHKLSHA